MLDLIREDVIGETWESYLAKLFDTSAAAEGLSKRLLASSSVIALISTFVTGEQDTAIQEYDFSTSFASNKVLHTVHTFNHDI